MRSISWVFDIQKFERKKLETQPSFLQPSTIESLLQTFTSPVRVELLEIISDENLWYLLRSKMKRYQNDILGFMIYTCLISWLLLGFSRNRKISNFENPRFILKFSQFQKSENRGIINRELKSVRLKIASTAQIG